MIEVLVKRTMWTPRILLDAYATAWTIVVGGTAPRAALALLLGQASVECGRNGQSCWNHNVGNVMAFASWTGEAHTLGAAPECGVPGALPAGARQLVSSNIGCAPGKVPYVPRGGSKFRAYDDFVEGCTDKLTVLQRQWPRSIVALAAATDASAATAFVDGLPGYFTADKVSYAASQRSLAAEFLRTVPEAEWPAERSLADTDPAPPLDSSEPTWPGTPTSKSSQRLKAVREPQPTFDGPVGIVVPEGEHTSNLDDGDDTA